MRLSTHSILGIALAGVLGILLIAPAPVSSQTPKPDLVVSGLVNPPTTALPGDSFVVTSTVANQGAGAAGISVTKFWLVSTTGPTKKNLKGVQNIPALAIGANATPPTTISVYSDTKPGTYFLQACADGDTDVSESNEGNNCKTTTGTITVNDVPDLTVTVLTSPPASVPQGGTFSVTDTVVNNGDVPAALSTTVKYTLTSTANGSKIDLKGKQTVPVLGPGQSFTDVQSLIVRPETLPGTYTLTACSDSGKIVTESNEDDNCKTATGTVQVTPMPDLIVQQATVAGVPLTVNQGDTVAITSVVRNQGLAGAAGSTLKFVLIDTSTLTEKNLKGTQAVPALGQGGQQTFQTNVIVYGDTAPGTYNVQVCADSGKVVGEISDGNNCTAAPGVVTIEGLPLSAAELAVNALTDPPTTALPGDSFQVTASVKNKESGPGGVSTVTKFYLQSTTGPTRKNLKGIQTVPDMGALEVVAVPVTVEVYSDTAPGTYFLQACADGDEVLNEINEVNNCRTTTAQVTVQQIPDLEVATVGNPPSSIFPGQLLSLPNVKVTNVGPVGAPASTVKFYFISATARIDLKGSMAVPAVGAGGSFTDTAAGLKVRPETLPGVYHAQACADSGKVVVEQDEDNCTQSTGMVTVNALPDLVVNNVQLVGPSVAVARGGTLAITAPVKNQGLGNAGTSKTKFTLVVTPGAAPVKNLDGLQNVPALIAGDKSKVQISVGVFSETPVGTYYVQACADTENTVSETNDNNNCATSTDLVTVQ